MTVEAASLQALIAAKAKLKIAPWDGYLKVGCCSSGVAYLSGHLLTHGSIDQRALLGCCQGQIVGCKLDFLECV